LGLKETDMNLDELFGKVLGERMELRSSIIEVPEGSTIEAELKKRGVDTTHVINLSKLMEEKVKAEGPGRDEDAAEGREWCHVCQEYHPTEKADEPDNKSEADRVKAMARVKKMIEDNAEEVKVLKELYDSISKPLKDRNPFDMLKEIILIKQLAHIHRD
jgi:phosphoribosylformylglycinamidine (FGAM) synthase PurS component